MVSGGPGSVSGIRSSAQAVATTRAGASVRAAWAVKQMVESYHQRVPPESRLYLGIGINTGEVVAGNIGAEDHMEYTLIGDDVNLAKRLQENAKPAQILLGQTTYQLVEDYVQVNVLEPIRVKGRAAAEQVYELIGLLPATRA